MKIEKQALVAKNVTEKLLKYISAANCKKLNVDEEGCWIDSIFISYSSLNTKLEVTFHSHDPYIKTFTCTATI
jgi:hypothetical protein